MLSADSLNSVTNRSKDLNVSPDIRARVLIVDDDPRSAATVKAQLGNSNEVQVSHSGTEALLKAREFRPDVILLDVMMPGVDGLEVCRRLRADPEIAEVRVFLLTALDGPSIRLLGFEAGADDFLTKPLNRSEALVRIQGIARLNRYRTLINQHRQLKLLQHSYRTPSDQEMLSATELMPVFDKALDDLYLVFHPIMEHDPATNSWRMFARECLLRTREPLLPGPASVLAAGAVLRRLPEVGRAVRTLAEQFLESESAEDDENTLFVNVTANDFSDEELFALDSPFARHAHRIVLELTEREPLDQIRDVRSCVRRLRAIGFRFALDDLGAGYSSLNSLAIIEPEFVKLDRHLVEGIASEPTRQKIIRSMVALCLDLDITMIVEGVETEAEQQVLYNLGCHLQQGWVFGKPSQILRAKS